MFASFSLGFYSVQYRIVQVMPKNKALKVSRSLFSPTLDKELLKLLLEKAVC